MKIQPFWKMKYFFPLAVAAMSTFLMSAGDPPIPFENPSFEGAPKTSSCPPNWEGFGTQNTPDTQPGAWEVESPDPKDGHTYVGLVVREDGTCERIGQKIPQKLTNGKCYIFSIWLSHAEHYAGFSMPIRLKVRGGASSTNCVQILGQSGLIDKKEWQEVRFQFTAASDIQYIIFEADYAPGTMFKYKGNILLDNLSNIIRCDRA